MGVAVTFQRDFESKCASPKFQQESQTKPPLSKIYSMFCKDTFIFTLIHAKKLWLKKACTCLVPSFYPHHFPGGSYLTPPKHQFLFPKEKLPSHNNNPLLSVQRCINSPPPLSGPPEWRLPRLRHELLSSAAPATRAVRVHRGTPGVVDAAAAGEGYGGRSS